MKTVPSCLSRKLFPHKTCHKTQCPYLPHRKAIHLLCKMGCSIFLFTGISLSVLSQPKVSVLNDSSAIDSTSILFEDLFGRYINAVGASGSLQHSKSTLRSSIIGVSSKNIEYNITEFSFMNGSRGTYQLSANLSNTSPNNPIQDYFVGGKYRPISSYELAGSVEVSHLVNPTNYNTYRSNASFTYLTNGSLTYDPDRFSHYLHFGDLVLDQNRILVLAAPVYNYSNYDYGGSKSKYSLAGSTFDAMFGMTNATTVEARGSYSNAAIIFQNPVVLNNAQVGSMHSDNQNTLGTFNANVKELFNEYLLGILEAQWEYSKSVTKSSNQYDNGFSNTTQNVDRTNSYVISATLNSLFLNGPSTIVDLRRSYYNMMFLESQEAANRFHFSYTPPDNPANQSIGLGDSVSYGALHFLQLDLSGNYAWGRKTFAPEVTDRWVLFAGCSIHNLTFTGQELNDFDYVFGRLVAPDDYLVCANWLRTQMLTSLSSTVSLKGQTGVLKNLDVGFAYQYQFGQGSTSYSYHISLRSNLFETVRFQISAGWGNSSTNETSLFGGSDARSFSIATSLNAVF